MDESEGIAAIQPHDGAMRLLAPGARPIAQYGVPTVTRQLYLRLAELGLLVMTRWSA
jgi:hypothetical protein